MKKKFIYLMALGAFAASCGAPEDNVELEGLKTKRDSLKAELVTVNEQITELDTATVIFMPLVSASKVYVQNFVHTVEVPGTVETDQNALINAESSGIIKRIHIQEGDRVSKGQTLITIDSEILASTMEELKTSLELAEYMFEKQQELKDKGVGVEIEYEQAKNQKSALEKKINTLSSQRGKTIVRAPFSGIVDDIMVSQGEMAAPQIPLLRIVNNSTVKVSATLSENLLGKVNIGTAVEIKFPSLNDTTIISVVTNKGNYIDPTNRTFRIQMEIKNNKVLLPNQFAEVKVTDFTRADAIVVDSESILQDTDNNTYVYRLTKTEDQGLFDVEKIFVKVIKQFEGQSCIEASVKDGDLLVVKGAKGITQTDQVTIQ